LQGGLRFVAYDVLVC